MFESLKNKRRRENCRFDCPALILWRSWQLKKDFGFRKRQEKVAVVSDGFLIHLPHNQNLAKKNRIKWKHTHAHTQIKPLNQFLFFLFPSSLRMSYFSVAIGYLAILLLMSITSSLFILCGKQQDCSVGPLFSQDEGKVDAFPGRFGQFGLFSVLADDLVIC